MVERYSFSRVDADYFQFHLRDGKESSNLAVAWTTEALNIGVTVAPYIIGVSTERNTSVWVDIEIHPAKPEFTQTIKWPRVIECSLNIPSGSLTITSPTLEESSQAHISLSPGWYRLRIHFAKNSQRGPHRYKIALWPTNESDTLIKSWPL
jgi:hypothetical protein